MYDWNITLPSLHYPWLSFLGDLRISEPRVGFSIRDSCSVNWRVVKLKG